MTRVVKAGVVKGGRLRRVLSARFGARRPATRAGGDAAAPPVAAEPVRPGGTLARVSAPAALETAFAVPFDYTPPPPADPRPIAVLAHLFYDDLAPELFGYLSHIPVPADVFLTTDTPAKRDAILGRLPSWGGGRIEVRVVPNRGRDIAPKLVALADVHRRYDRVLHLHGKKSEHWEHGQTWRQYLYEVLVGSPEVVRSILATFDNDPRLGMVLPQHWGRVQPWVDWGYDYRHCREFAGRLGIDLTRDQPLEFPSGSMFWARSAALKHLLDLDLSFEQFPNEGFKGGSLAHVIERLYLRACERSGHTWLKAARPDLSPDATEIVRIASPAGLREFLRTRPYLLGDPALRQRASAPLAEPSVPWPRLRFQPDGAARPRLTVLAGAAETGEVARTGGILDIAGRVAASGGDAELRIVGSETCLHAARERGLGHAELLAAPPPGLSPPAPLPVRAGEALFAASWRDAADASALAGTQESFFGQRPSLIVWIAHEPEPNPGARLAEAEACRRSADTLALFASPAACAGLQRRGRVFARCEVLRPLWNPALDAARPGCGAADRPPVLLVDWQPSRPDALAGLAAAAIGRWLEQDPPSARHWTIYGIGEPGAEVGLAAGRSLRPVGYDPDGYAALLGQARLGLSLTLDGEPSRIALEMAACGAATVIGPGYGAHVSRIGMGLVPAVDLDVASVAAALDAAAARQSGRHPAGRDGGAAPPGFWSVADLDALAQRIAAWIGVGAPLALAVAHAGE